MVRTHPSVRTTLEKFAAERALVQRQLSDALTQAQQAGFVPEELELNLQLALLTTSPSASPLPHTEKAPRPDLCDLARRAHGLGLMLAANRASAAAIPDCAAAAPSAEKVPH